MKHEFKFDSDGDLNIKVWNDDYDITVFDESEQKELLKLLKEKYEHSTIKTSTEPKY